MNRARVLSFLAGASAAAFGAPLRSFAQAPTVVRIAGPGTDDITPLLYALKEGLFFKAGLDVHLDTRAVGVINTAILEGALDIAKNSLLGLVQAYERGIKFKMLVGAAVYSSTAPTTQIIVMKESPIKSLADLSGKTCGVPAVRALNALGTQALIDSHGGKSSTVKFVEMPYTAMVASLERGSVDFAEIVQPYLQVAIDSGKIRTIEDPFAGLGDPAPISVWFTSEEYAAKNPTVVRRFIDVMRPATTYTLAHLQETAPVFSEFSHIELDVVRKMVRTPMEAVLSERALQKEIDIAAKYGYISRAFSAKELLVVT